MADQIEQDSKTTENEADDPQASAEAQTGDATDENAERTFTQADVDRILKERLDRFKKQSDDAAAKATAEAERKAAEEQGKFRELYEAEKAKAEQAAEQLRQTELREMRRAAASKVGLTPELADRLRGETPEDIEADAKQLAAALPKPAAPNANSLNGQGLSPRPGQTTEAERNELAARYGVRADLIPAQ